MSSVAELFRQASTCTRCYGDQSIYVPLPDPKNAASRAKVLFVNERPGRIGTGASGYVSFDNPDPTARLFKELFSITGLERTEVIMTNACLCHPRFDGYRDKAPTVREIRNCHHWLQKQIEICQPKLIVTVGRVAYQSVLRLMNLWPLPGRPRFIDRIGEVVPNSSPTVYPVVHTSAQGRLSRPIATQREDWAHIKEVLRALQDAT